MRRRRARSPPVNRAHANRHPNHGRGSGSRTDVTVPRRDRRTMHGRGHTIYANLQVKAALIVICRAAPSAASWWPRPASVQIRYRPGPTLGSTARPSAACNGRSARRGSHRPWSDAVREQPQSNVFAGRADLRMSRSASSRRSPRGLPHAVPAAELYEPGRRSRGGLPPGRRAVGLCQIDGMTHTPVA